MQPSLVCSKWLSRILGRDFPCLKIPVPNTSLAEAEPGNFCIPSTNTFMEFWALPTVRPEMKAVILRDPSTRHMSVNQIWGKNAGFKTLLKSTLLHHLAHAEAVWEFSFNYFHFLGQASTVGNPVFYHTRAPWSLISMIFQQEIPLIGLTNSMPCPTAVTCCNRPQAMSIRSAETGLL